MFEYTTAKIKLMQNQIISKLIQKTSIKKSYLWKRMQSNFERRLRIEIPVFVFQMGKVASNSIYQSLTGSI